MEGSPGRAECYREGCVGGIKSTGWKVDIVAINCCSLSICYVLGTPLDVFLPVLHDIRSRWGLSDSPKSTGYQEAVWDTDRDRSVPLFPCKDPGGSFWR